jgi:putative ABC transport system permease protein
MALVPATRQVLASLDPGIPYWQVTTGMELRAQDVADTRILALLLWVFSGLALLLSGTGLWAVVAQAAAERRREIGLRMALGARARQMEAMVLRQGIVPVIGGAGMGLALAALAAPRISDILFGVGPRNLTPYLGAALILAAVGLLATWIPARRAAGIDPMEALASE